MDDLVLDFIETLKGRNILSIEGINEGMENNPFTIEDCAIPILEEIFMQGNCGRFALVLKKIFPEAKFYYYNCSTTIFKDIRDAQKAIEYAFNHVYTMINGNYYDIRGKIELDEFIIKHLEEVDEKFLYDNDLTDNYSFKHRGPII
jgi:hypothetical protein